LRGASKAGWEAQREQVRAGEQALVENIRIAFYDWQIISRKAALQRGIIERWERLAQVATNQVRLGKLSEVDQAEAQLNVVKARQRELALLSEREGKESELQVLVGQPAALRAERMDTLFALPPSDSLYRWASEANPFLLAFRKNLDANRQRVLLEEGLSKPGFSLSVGYERESEGDNLVGAGIEMPLPIANRNQAGILKAKSGLRETELRLAAAETGLKTDISALHQRLARLSEQYSHYQGEVRDLIRKQMNLSEKGFREGLIGVFDLSRVQAEYLTQEEEALVVLEEFYRIWNRLSTLVGGRI
jgi:outer membrane protein TolC